MRSVTLGELGEFKNGVNFKRDCMGRGLPLINVKDITSSHCIDPEKLDLVDVNIGEECVAEMNDIFFVRSSVKLDGIALVGKLSSSEPRPIHCGFVIRFRLTSTEVCSDYLLYLLLSPEYRQRLKGLSGGAAIVNISQTNLKRLSIPLPNLNVQQKIAVVLRSYDDLIENNQRRIQLLEQAARLLYKEWFVHLRFPGHQHTVITNGVPEGWERKPIGNVCETVGGGTPSTKISEYWGGDITWVVPTDVTRNNCLALLDSERKINERGLRTSSAKMVPAETILMTSRASVGFFALMNRPVCTNQGFINIIPHYEEIRMYLLFNLINRVAEIRSNAKGTTYPEISKQRFRQMDIVIPSKTLAVKFANIASNIIQQERILKRSIFRLTEARELLLPRLISRKGNLLPNALEAV